MTDGKAVILGSSPFPRFIPLARLMAEMQGGWPQAAELALRFQAAGAAAVGNVSSDLRLLLLDRARSVGVINSAEEGNPIAIAELLLVIDILAAAGLPARPEPEPVLPHLVFTLPAPMMGLVDAHLRLDLIVREAVTSACIELTVGGPFWDEAGVDLLLPMMSAAIGARGVAVTIYAHRHETPGRARDYDAPVRRMVSLLQREAERSRNGSARLLWFSGPSCTMMHAKFIVTDRRGGYLGTANLTSRGLREHLEVGVPLAPSQAAQLVSLLDSMESRGWFVAGSTDECGSRGL